MVKCVVYFQGREGNEPDAGGFASTQSSLLLTAQKNGGGGSFPSNAMTQDGTQSRPSGKQQQRDILKSDAVPLIFNCHPEQNVCCQDAIMNSDQTLIFPYCEQPWPLQHGYKGKIILWLKFKFTFQKNKPKIFLFQPKSLIHPTSSFLHHYQIHHFLFIHFFIFMK
ncbi:uncharacterized protein LOC125036306 isoform X4 [Penaeus chinensis]|nr:uncharacterized protein LOC125036306 isoform X4 [Penaeus chinensis]